MGARSAVFAAMRGVGLIVVDEEHDPAYKQESDPRYDARTVAAKRAALEGAVAVYGSATPRPESWARLRRSSLSSRIGAPLPRVRLVDLRREGGYPLSAPLLQALGGLVEDGGRAILLLNRRGVAPAVHCRACGVSRRCDLCDVALTLHADEVLHCHHCGRSAPVPRQCPACGSVELARIGAGTQRLEVGARSSPAGARADPARRGRLEPPGRAARDHRALSPGRPHGAARHADRGQGASLPRRGARGRHRRGHRPLAAGLSAPRSERSSSSRSSPGEAVVTHPVGCSCRRSSPMPLRCGTP